MTRLSTGASGVPRLVIAGASSGVGKTTLTAGLLAALRSRGLTVQPFKAGPDYIDPSYHTLAAGRPCRNLDTWMLPAEAVRSTFERACRGAQLAIIEGVMGVYDGFGYDDDEGSTARLAKLLDAPVVIVLNVSSLGRSAGAMALGYAGFDRSLRVAGFIANNAGSTAHGQGTAHAISVATGLPCFGWLPRAASLEIPERHLGLIPTAEPGEWERFVAAAAAHVSEHLDMDGLLALAAPGGIGHQQQVPGSPTCSETAENGHERMITAPDSDRPVIAVARDEAFSFYYEDNLDLLREAGAQIVFFSPLRDHALPSSAAGLYLGGGFPEMYAAGLADNQDLRTSLRQALGQGLPGYAECGGLMYLTASLTDTEGIVYPMVGVLPGRSVMTRRLTMGYRTVTTCHATFLAPACSTIRGHEFHYSDWVDYPDSMPAAYHTSPLRGAHGGREGYAHGNLIASYVHLHFGAAPGLAVRMVGACRAWAELGQKWG
jgi:cobyrinic acid a,c-diamide synthase